MQSTLHQQNKTYKYAKTSNASNREKKKNAPYSVAQSAGGRVSTLPICTSDQFVLSAVPSLSVKLLTIARRVSGSALAYSFLKKESTGSPLLWSESTDSAPSESAPSPSSDEDVFSDLSFPPSDFLGFDDFFFFFCVRSVAILSQSFTPCREDVG